MMGTSSSKPNEVSIHDMDWKGVSLTEVAARRVLELSQGGKIFHLNVKPSGCTGFAYDIKLMEQPLTDDLSFSNYDVVFYVALTAMPMIDGTTIDYVRQGLNSLFVYDNPNVKNMCGCGESFGV